MKIFRVKVPLIESPRETVLQSSKIRTSTDVGKGVLEAAAEDRQQLGCSK